MKTVHVAVAVIKNTNGDVLIARRSAQQHQGGLWEFPGGKVEMGETVFTALQREIREEVALEILAAQPLLKIPFTYPDKKVLLDVWQVSNFSGTARPAEGQPIQWVPVSTLVNYDFPAANRAIVAALRLPERVLITGDFSSPEDCVQRVQRALADHAIDGVMLRAHALDSLQFARCAAALKSLCAAAGATLLLNAPVDSAALDNGDGVHLTAQRLLQCSERPTLPVNVLLGASCHHRAELEHAVAIGADYVTLSPVLATRSHPNEPVLGWSEFAALVAACPLPVLALGGLDGSHLPRVKALGGYGIAAISTWWNT